jgi:predicted branched-subunit amino acid permease
MNPKLAEFLAGCRDEAPLQLGVVPFGMIYGIGALAAGIPAWLAQLTSAVLFAGAAQLVVVQMLAAGAAALPIGATATLLNLRHMLYSASIAGHVRHLPRRWRLLLAYLLTDEAYAVAILRYQMPAANAADADPAPAADLRHWYFLGCGFTLWFTWQLSTAAGIVFGATIPPEWEIDFAVPLTFIALLTLLLRDRAGQAAALVAAVAVLAFASLPYQLGLPAAIVVGLGAGVWAARRTRATRARR